MTDVGGEEKCVEDVGRKPCRKGTLGGPRRRLDNNIKTILMEMRRDGCEADSSG